MCRVQPGKLEAEKVRSYSLRMSSIDTGAPTILKAEKISKAWAGEASV